MSELNDIYLLQKNIAPNALSESTVQEFNHKWTGKVLDNNDPLMLGRVKIRIIGFYDEIADNAIPWALPESSYVGSKKGSFIVPEVGSIVRGYFDNGDDQKPIYTAIAANVSNYATTDAISHPDEALDYPHVMVLFQTDEGERVTLNRNSGEMKVVHRTGTTLEITPEGRIKIQTNKPILDKNKDVGADILIAGTVNVTTEQGEINLKAKMSNININTTGGTVNLGNNAIDKVDPITGEKRPSTTKVKVNCLRKCLFTGVDHCDPIALPNVNVYV